MIDEAYVRHLLAEVRRGTRPVASALRALKRFPTDHLGFARVDTHRRLRRGVPEAIWCEGKTPAQLVRLSRRFLHAHEVLLLTRLAPEPARHLQHAIPQIRYDPVARMGYWHPGRRLARRGLVVIASAGTADLPIAEEACLTLELLGSRAARLYDVGVAGLHRVLASVDLLQRARAVVVAAGMEGALASVVAGLVRAPVIAVPTSVGYGASFAGIGPLLTMLNSCAPGVGVVNIDNGFGAGYLAHVINVAACSRRR